MNIERRLTNLRRIYPPPRCPVCWWWSSEHTVLCDDGGACLRGEVCPSCGRYVAITHVAVLGDISLDDI